ncbi:hypothetical protein A7P98_04565 [Eikenella sp. NML080894]|nr:hypothetical protein A7P98_04565 [Eikenella sp. NML080894]OAM44762.1 hypothetical protein A7Q03_08105 [Eikenella sp. NML99-0057]
MAQLPVHAAVVCQPLLLSRFPNGIGYALCLVTWLMLLLCWRGSFFYSLKGLQLLYPFAALSMPAAAQWPALGADYAVGNMPFLYTWAHRCYRTACSILPRCLRRWFCC